MNSNRRVAITGIGVVSALGPTRDAFWRGLIEGRSAIRPMELVPKGAVRFPNAAEVSGFQSVDYFDDKDAEVLDRFAQFAVVAAREAIAGSGAEFRNGMGERTAVVTGSCVGGQTTEDNEFRGLYALGHTRFPPMTIPKAMANAGASRISLDYGITGPVFTISTACSSGNHALGLAFWMVRSGMVEAAIAGGSEAPFSLGLLKAWEAMRVVAVLEDWDSAQARGARIWGELAGFGMSSDAHHITQPTAEGPARAMRAALADAAAAPEAVGYINAHGTGTPSNDATEAEAIRSVFGAHAEKLMVSSTKSMHGHALAAAGAMEAAGTVLALRDGIIPPTANFTEPDPACDLDVVPNTARTAQVEWALSNSFAFGGLNAVLVFRRID